MGPFTKIKSMAERASMKGGDPNGKFSFRSQRDRWMDVKEGRRGWRAGGRVGGRHGDQK